MPAPERANDDGGSIFGTGDRAALDQLGRLRRFRAGSTVFAEGDRSNHVLFRVEGWVKVFCTTPDGHEPVLAIRRAGELLGELAAIDAARAPRTATVVALEPVVAREITAAQFGTFLAGSPSAAMALLRCLSARLRGSDRRRVEYGSLDATHRLARVLAELGSDFGVPDGSEIRIDLAISQQELADMIGSSRESIGRALTEMRSRGLIRTDRRRIVVNDLVRLRDYE